MSKHRGRAITIRGLPEWQPTAELAPDARIFAQGNRGQVWYPDDAKFRGEFGSLVNHDGQEVFIVDLLRATIPADDPRWSDTPPPPAALPCRTYWGSHACDLPRGHVGGHACDCCDCPDHSGNNGVRHDYREHEEADDVGWLCAAREPYFGPDTEFYGEDSW